MIVGQKIRLRPLEEGDLALAARWRNQARVLAQFFSPYPVALSEQRQWYQRYLADDRERMWVIETLDGRPIGTLALCEIDLHHQRAELGRVMIGEEDCLGRGYAADAVRTLAAYAFREANLNRIYLQVLSDNTRAIHLYERCGFQIEGLLRRAVWKGGAFRDVLLMAALRDDWLAARGDGGSPERAIGE